MRDIEFEFEEVKPLDVRPIWLCNVKYTITVRRKPVDHYVKNVVLSGTVGDIAKDHLSLSRIMAAHFANTSDVKKKVKAFDYSRLDIVDVEFVKRVGHGLSR